MMQKIDINDLPGVHKAPNIQSNPAAYEIENLALDPERKIEAAMAAIAPWQGKVVLDLGAGTGFYLERFHKEASHVIGVEPHGPSRLAAMARVVAAGLERVSVMTGSAEQILLPDKSVDIVQARFAYFFAPHCEPGLKELERVIRPGGTAFIIDNDLENGTFAAWLNRHPAHTGLSGEFVERWWAERGFSLTRIASEWRFQNRADLELVVRNEFPPDLADELLTEHAGLSIDYGYCLYHRHY